jgi:hypothetical protein
MGKALCKSAFIMSKRGVKVPSRTEFEVEESLVRLTLAAADAKIWGGWWVGVGAWGKGR